MFFYQPCDFLTIKCTLIKHILRVYVITNKIININVVFSHKINLSQEPSILINTMKFHSIFSFKNKKKKSKAENKVLSLVDDDVSPPQISSLDQKIVRGESINLEIIFVFYI